MKSTYFTQEFNNLPDWRKVEEISAELIKMLCYADADTDANIAVVDNLLELRKEVLHTK